ncbi:MAG TPA: hypothetical protein ENI76_00675 [Ignavibacteria bacterium]|mgnify:CR=1 FL=1|nr:hypothetical protein [Ignavibacteria bacterium]
MSNKATQDFVSIKEVRDGVVVMNDGSMRMILMASSLNLALKSEDEQTAIILQFQNFLNSLDFSVQIFIQSRKYDIRPYIAQLEKREKQQLNDLLKIQTREYINFIRNFTENTNIMSKNFFVIVSYTPSFISGSGKSGISRLLFGKSKKTKTQNIEDFETNKSQLEQRIYVVQQGLIRSGVRTVALGTQEVIELFYRMFNPGEQEKPIQLG